MKKILTALIIALIVMVFGSSIFFMYLRSNQQEYDSINLTRSDFLPNRFAVGRSRFEEVMSHDFENNYPTTVAAVIARYTEIYNLIHGNFLDNDELLRKLVIQKRHLLSPELRENNPLEIQLENLHINLQNLASRNFHYIGFRQLSVEYDIDIPTVAVVDVVHYGSTQLNIRISYVVEWNLEEERWFIQGWTISEQLGRST